jgi:hypothetical protein
MTNDTLERELRSLAAPGPDDEQLRVVLRAQLLRQPVRRRRSTVRLAFAAAGCVVAAAAAVIALVGTSSTGGPGVAGAAILHHTLVAMTPPPGAIVHVKTVDTENGVQFVGEWWQQTGAPYASRALKGTAGRYAEFADDGTTSYTYDSATNTIYERPDSTPPTAEDPVSTIRGELANGHARLIGPVTVAGEPLYAMVLSNGVTAYVDKVTYVPRYLDEPQRDGSSVRFDVVTYEHLAATADNLRLLSMTAAHPGARLDRNPSDWPTGVGK